MSQGRSRPKRWGGRCRWIVGAVLGALVGTPASAATYYELNGPVRLNSGTMSWMGKGSPSLKGAVDVACGPQPGAAESPSASKRSPRTIPWTIQPMRQTATARHVLVKSSAWRTATIIATNIQMDTTA